MLLILGFGMERGVRPFPTQPFLGLSLAAVTTRDTMDLVLQAARERSAPLTAAYLNAATVNLAFENADYARLLARMSLLYADGMAVVWAARRLGRPIPERVNAGDFTREFMLQAARQGLRLALVGGRPARPGEGSASESGEAERAAALFRQWAPGLQIVLTHHGYLDDPAASAAAAAAIERADPDLVLLGMGSPRQEERALAWAAAGRPRAWWCVGALFEYYAGTRARAPIWMRRAGLEWVFRLALEPGRLWRRYLIGNPAFIFRVLRARPPAGLIK